MRSLPATVVLLVMLCCFSLPSSSQVQTPEKNSGNGFSPQQQKWAVQWINKRLTLLMEDGLIKRIKCPENEDSYEVFVSPAWEAMTIEDKRSFLADFSLARQVTGHAPFLVIKSDGSGEMLAEVNGRGIFLFGGEGEYFSPRDR